MKHFWHTFIGKHCGVHALCNVCRNMILYNAQGLFAVSMITISIFNTSPHAHQSVHSITFTTSTALVLPVSRSNYHINTTSIQLQHHYQLVLVDYISVVSTLTLYSSWFASGEAFFASVSTQSTRLLTKTHKECQIELLTAHCRIRHSSI